MKRNSSITKFSLVIVLAIIILGIFYFFPFLRQSKDQAVSFIMRPFYNLGLKLQALKNLSDWQSENQRLREQLARQNLDYFKLQSLQAENSNLRRELNFITERKISFVLANVVGRQPNNPNVLILDRGSSSGLEVGSPATVSGGVLVGLIMETSPSQSLLRLLTDPDSQIPVTPMALAGTNGLLRGQTGNTLLLDLLPQNVEVKPEDQIVTSGILERIPQGLLIGKISQVDTNVGEVFKQAKVVTPFSYDSLQILTIIKR